MKATPVDRYTFTVEEVVAAILPNVGHRREVELRVDLDGFVVVDIVQPLDQRGSARPEEEPATRKVEPPAPAGNDAAPRSEPGPAEREAISLCGQPLFRAFLEVKTEEAAQKVLAERAHVARLSDLDRTKSHALNLRHVVEEFEAWKIT
ncbi:hypothetical protein LJR221_001501 [Agrobacterium tumefaciens]